MDNYTQKTKKEIHIVFQVLNFLKSDHHLATITNSNEHRLLIVLASHKGAKGIFPSISILMKELKVTKSTVKRAIKKWRDLEVIYVEENSGKNNHYFLYIPEPTSVTGDTSVSSDTRFTGDTPPGSVVGPTRVSSGPHIRTKEELKKNKKSFYSKKAENKKKHEFAVSMDQMAREAEHIDQHERLKKEPICSKMKSILSAGIKKP